MATTRAPEDRGAEDGVHNLVFVGGDDAVQAEAERAVVVARWANRARDLANEPPNDLTPAGLAEHAERIADESDGRLRAESFGRERMTELGMGSFLAVSQGSAQEPRTIVLRYDPPDAAGDATLGLVGKAVTFDTGGISIKPALYMEDMKGDMSGGAAVLAGLGAIAELGLPVRAIGVVGATENMVGGGAYRPGDIVRAMNGTTIEIVNTDAEGRLVLADVLWYARQQGATHLVDFATLTGAMEKALGDLYAGVFGNDDEWRDRVVDAGNRSGDLAWGASDPSPVPQVHRLRLCGSEELVRARPGDPRLRCGLPPEVRRRGPVGPYRPGRAGLSALAAAGLPPRRRRHRVRRAADRRAGTLLPVNLDLTDEHELLRRTVRDFAVERVGPVAEELDREHRFPYELVKEMAELGLMGMTIPEEYGGAGTDTVSYAIAVEELTRVD